MTPDEVFVDLPQNAVDALKRNIDSLRVAAQYPNLTYVAADGAAPVPAADLEVLAAAGLVRVIQGGAGTAPLYYRVTADGYARISLYLEATA